MGVESGGTTSKGTSDDPFEQPWRPRERGRHALDQRVGYIRVEQLVRSHLSLPLPHIMNGTRRSGAAPADPIPDRVSEHADHLNRQLAAARAEIEELTGALLDAQISLDAAREDSEAVTAGLRAELEDRQTDWDVRMRELEKELDEVSAELAQDRAAAEDAGAEADAAFVELAEAFAELSAAEARIAELESTTARRRRAR